MNKLRAILGLLLDLSVLTIVGIFVLFIRCEVVAVARGFDI